MSQGYRQPDHHFYISNKSQRELTVTLQLKLWMPTIRRVQDYHTKQNLAKLFFDDRSVRGKFQKGSQYKLIIKPGWAQCLKLPSSLKCLYQYAIKYLNTQQQGYKSHFCFYRKPFQTKQTLGVIVENDLTVKTLPHFRKQIQEEIQLHNDNLTVGVIKSEDDYNNQLSLIASQIPPNLNEKLKDIILHRNIWSIKYLDLNDVGLNDSDLMFLIKHASEFYNLTILLLKGNEISIQGLKCLAQNGKKFGKLTSINLECNQITDEGLKVFLKNMKDFQELQQISLMKNQITGEGFKDLIDDENILPKIKFINFAKNKLTNQGIKFLAKCGKKLPSLDELQFQEDDMTDQGIQIFALNNTFSNLQSFHITSCCGYYPILQSCYSRKNKISDKGVKAFVQNANNFPNLHTLSFENIKIGAEGLKALAKNFKQFSNLKRISLENNYMTDQGLKTFVENAPKFRGLQFISFSNNKISGQGFATFLQNTNKFPHLKQLHFRSNLIGDEGVKPLVENLRKFLDRVEIDLSNNNITDKGLQILIEAKEKLPIYDQIRITDNKITQEAAKKVQPRLFIIENFGLFI